jgi:hypothetical protein
MCQDDLGSSTVLTPFIDDEISELIAFGAGGHSGARALHYARRVARLATVLHDLLEELDGVVLDPEPRERANGAWLALTEESAAAKRGGEV